MMASFFMVEWLPKGRGKQKEIRPETSGTLDMPEINV